MAGIFYWQNGILSIFSTLIFRGCYSINLKEEPIQIIFLLILQHE